MANQSPDCDCGRDKTDHAAHSHRPVRGAAKVHEHCSHGLEERKLERDLPWLAENRELRKEQIDSLLVIDQCRIGALGLTE
jgi:hypothetical protein